MIHKIWFIHNENDIKLRPDSSKSEATKSIRSSTVFVDKSLSLFLEGSSEWDLFAIDTDVWASWEDTFKYKANFLGVFMVSYLLGHP